MWQVLHLKITGKTKTNNSIKNGEKKDGRERERCFEIVDLINRFKNVDKQSTLGY